MRDLIVIGYPDAKAAEAARDSLLALPREEIFRISDAVVAARDKKGAIRLSHIVRSGALNLGTGTMSGLLIGLLFLHPIFGILAGAAAGAAAGAVGEGLSGVGVSEEFVREVDDVLRPGRAALLVERNVATKHEFDDHVIAKLAASGGCLLKTSLKASLEHKLRLAFEEARNCARNEAAPGADRAAG
jgi:uncharacterized membrane protein